MKVKNWLNAHEFPTVGEVNTQPSLTVPDQTMSMREILDRFAKGLPVTGARVPVFDEEGEENDLPDPRTMDLVDRQEMAQRARQELNELRSSDARRKAEIEAKKAQDEADLKEAAKVIREKRESGTNNP